MLTPRVIGSRTSPRYADVRTVSQVLLRLERAQGDPFEAVQQEVLSWIGRRAGRALPPEAWAGQTFELEEVGAQRVAAVKIEAPQYWAARIDDADQYVAQRTWTTEIGLATAPEGGALFGCRLIVSARGDNPVYQPSIPSFVREVVLKGAAFLDSRAIGYEPWVIRSKADVDELYALMVSKARRSNIAVFSLAEDQEDVGATAASASAVQRSTLGAAHVAVITGPAAFMLTDLVGKEFAVFNRAIRTYRPNFDTDSDDPRRHPLALAHHIINWQDMGADGPQAFESFLARNLILQSVAAEDLERLLPPFSKVRSVASAMNLDKAQSAGVSTDEMLRLYEEDNRKLRADFEEEKATHDGLLISAEQERDEAQRRADEARSESYRLNLRIRTLELQLRSKGGIETATPIPADLDELKDWSDANVAGSVIVTNRALRGAKESEYEDPELVYRTLLLLRDYYVPMREDGGEDRAKLYAEALRRLGLEESPSITAARLGEQGDEYLVAHNGRKRELDRHFKKGASRESRRCFRLYFFWDGEDKQVVVGWLTSHLGTRES